MSLEQRKKLKNEVNIAEKYLKFLMETYVMLSSGYTTYRIGAMLKKHSVDKHTFSGLVSIGWVTKLATKNGTKCFWRGPVPTLDNVDEVKQAIAKYKHRSRIKLTTPVSITGKKLIPIVNTVEEIKRTPIVKTDATQRYYTFLQDLKSLTQKASHVNITNLVKKHRVGKGSFGTMIDLGYLIKTSSLNSKSNYTWNYGEVTNELAQELLTQTTLKLRTSKNTIKPLINIKKSKTLKPNSLVKESKELNKEFAMKLFKLGYLKEANDVLDSLIQ